MPPETRYAKSGEVHIAYQVVGGGPIDLVLVPGFWSQVEHQWEEPGFARFMERLSSFCRLIVFDARGTGLSDRAQELPPMDEQMDDVQAVLDAVGSSSAAFFGLSQAGPMAILFAASHPERTRALILYGSYATPRRHDDYPWGRTPEWMENLARQIDRDWGSGSFLSEVAPTRVKDESFRRWWGRLERLSYGPGNALAYFRMRGARHDFDSAREALARDVHETAASVDPAKRPLRGASIGLSIVHLAAASFVLDVLL